MNKHARPGRSVQRVARWLLLPTLWLALQAAAAPLPPMEQTVSMVARETSASEFIEELFGLANIPVVVDSQVNGTVNGYFSDSASQLLKRTMKSLKLMTYYDGQVAHVYNARDLKQEVLPVSQSVARRIVDHINLLSLTDQQNSISAGSAGGLVVKGAPRFVEQVKDASTSIRSNTKKYVPLVVEKLFYLRHAWVQDTTLEMGGQSMVVPGIVSILNELISRQPLDESARPPADSRVGPVTRMPDNGTLAVANSLPADSASLRQPAVKPQAPAATGENEATRVVAVPRLNAVLVRDLESRMASYASLIQALDVEPYMLEIEATIIDINSDRSEEFGVNWRYQRGDGNEALVGNGTFSDQLLSPDTQITPQGQGGILSLALGNPAAQFLARIRALEQQGEAEIVSKPHVVTLSNVEAVLDTTQSFFVRVAAADDAALFKITAGTTLRVTPHVYRMDGSTRIKLMVHIQDGATSDAEVDQIPVIGNSNIRTQAIITDGDSLLVGGLVRESRRDGVTKVPFLGDIPGLGSIFRTNTTAGSKVERLFLITPRLAFRNGFNQGKRMDAPVLQGSQQDIIGTAGNRLQHTIKAIDEAEVPQNSPVAPSARTIVASPLPQDAQAGGAERDSTTSPTPSAPPVPETVNPQQFIAVNEPQNSGGSRKQVLQGLLAVPARPSPARLPVAVQHKAAAANTVPASKRQQWTVQALPHTATAEAAKTERDPPAVFSSATAQAVVVAKRRKPVAALGLNRSRDTAKELQWQEIKPSRQVTSVVPD